MLSKWGQRFSPLSLFAAGEQGGWWDPSDFSTMFQDSGGTTPVTAVTQPVGMIRDKSGRGNHRVQGTAASRPTLQRDASGFLYLQYDGVDDSMATAATVDLSATAAVSMAAGIRKESDAATGNLIELSATDANIGTFALFAGVGVVNSYRLESKGTAGSSAGTGGTDFPAPIFNVLSGQCNITTDTNILRVNGAQAATGIADQGTGNYTNATLFFGRRNNTSNPFTGREYSMVLVGRALTASELASIERYAGSKMGIVL